MAKGTLSVVIEWSKAAKFEGLLQLQLCYAYFPGYEGYDTTLSMHDTLVRMSGNFQYI